MPRSPPTGPSTVSFLPAMRLADDDLIRTKVNLIPER